MIAYASVYGNTANAADILACRLRELGIKTIMYDVSVTPASDIIAAAFKWSHLVFASTTYNAGVFVTMEALINDLVAHNIQNRTVGIIENGTWAGDERRSYPARALEKCKNMTFVGDKVSIKSSVKPETLESIFALADGIAATMPKHAAPVHPTAGNVDASALFRLSYGLFVLTAREGDRDNGLHHQYRDAGDRFAETHFHCGQQGKSDTRYDKEHRCVQSVRADDGSTAWRIRAVRLYERQKYR